MPGLRTAQEFTNAIIDKLAPPENGDRALHWDSMVPGLGIRVLASGKKIWFVAYRVKGSRVKTRITLGPYGKLRGEIPLTVARDKARVILARAVAGEDPQAEVQAVKGAAMFKDFAQDYMEKYVKLRKKTDRNDREILKNHLLPAWGERRISEITRRDVVSLIEGIRERAPVMANRVHAAARAMFNWGLRRDEPGLLMNPCALVQPVTKETPRDRWLDKGELRAVWRALEADPSSLSAAIFKVTLLTAQRSGEVKQMRWDQVDLEGGWWTIPATLAKNGRTHRVPLAPAVVEILQALQGNHSEWVFPSPKLSGKETAIKPILNLSKATERLVKASEVSFSPHDLRRTAASWMTSIGVPRDHVAKILNHVDGSVTAIYDRNSYDKEKRAALELWAERLMAMVC